MTSIFNEGGVGPVPGSAFQGRKSCGPGPALGPRRAGGAWWSRGPGMDALVAEETNLSLRPVTLRVRMRFENDNPGSIRLEKTGGRATDGR